MILCIATISSRRSCRAGRGAAWLLGLAALGAGARALATGEAPVVLRVSSEVVSAADFRERLESLPFAAALTDSAVMATASSLADKIVLTLDARRNVRGDTTGLAEAVVRIRHDELLKLYRAEVVRVVECTPELENRVFGWLGEELRVKHILTSNERTARAIMLELEGGADFARLARTHSVDVWTKEGGGLLDWFTYGELAGIEDAAFPLSVGDFAGPVWTHRGWHVVALEERRSRERHPNDFGSKDFGGELRARLEEHAWNRHGDDLWRKLDARWNETGLEMARDIHLRHEVSADSLKRALARQREAEGGGAAPAAAELPPLRVPEALSRSVVIETRDFAYTVGHVAGLLRTMEAHERPRSYELDVYRHWLEPRALDTIAVEHALRNGFADRPEVMDEVENAIDFFFVQRLYDHEIMSGVNPTEADVREHFEANRESYFWRPDIDLTVLKGRDPDVLHDARQRLLSGVSLSLIREAFGRRDTSFEVFQTGPKREFPEVAGLDRVARALGDQAGAVSEVTGIGGEYVAVRIENVGESALMTFADAYDLAQETCTTLRREERLRTILDSLRVVYDARIDEAAALAAARSEGQ